MASFIELIAKIKQKNNGDYALVDAEDIECEDGKRLNVVLNEKLDKNQGVENAGKTMVVGADGNLVVGDSSPKNVYTKEEVNYLLDDKMDKPYYDIAITDDTTIETTLAGNFKIDSIEGSIYQAQETDIVPTPSRPVPINSRKVKAGEEYVELRSLKETSNMFDYRLYALLNSEYVSLNDDGTGIKILKPDDRDISEIPYELDFDINTYLNFMWDGENGQGIELHVYIKYPDQDWQEFSTVADGTLKAQLGVGNHEPLKMRFKFVGVTGAEKTNIGLFNYVLGDIAYVPPTVRDYKIVDHTAKTAKIVRNVKNIRVTSKLINNGFNDYTETMKRAIIRTLDRFIIDNVTKAGDDLSNMAITRFGSLQNGNVFANVSGIANMYWYPDISMFGLNGNETKDVASQKLVEFLTNNEMYVQYQLATPVEETITYVETDVSEVGYSWQDTTSPSPTIKSEIYEVDKINIKLIGKNFIDIDYISNIDNWTNSNTDGYYYIPIEVPKNAQLVISNDVKIPAGRGYYANFSPYKEKNAENYYFIYHNVSGSALGKFTSITKSNVVYLRINSINVNLPLFVEDFKKMQLEIGSVATSYTPYQETSIQHALSKPLRATKDGSIKDIIDIVNMQITYNMTDFIVDGNTTITLGTDKEKTRVIQINTFPFLNPTNNLKMCCDKLVNDSGKDEELFTVSTALYIAINKNRVAENDISEFKKWFGENPLYFIGISKNPTTEPLDDELVEKLKTLKTFSSVTHVFVEGIAKPKLTAKYPKDIAAAQAQLEAKVITLQEAVIKNV